jgi:hypothetical protein
VGVRRTRPGREGGLLGAGHAAGAGRLLGANVQRPSSPEGQATVADIGTFATGGATVLIAAVD